MVPNNTNIVEIINAVEEANRIYDIVVTNDLVTKCKEFTTAMTEIKESYITVINSLAELNEYIEANITEFSGLNRIQKLLNSLFQITDTSINYSDMKFNQNMIDDVYDIINSLYYMSFLATSNEKRINEGLDVLIGDETAAYMPFLQDNVNFYEYSSDNSSLVYKYFLINTLLSKLTENTLQKGWFFKLFFHNLKLKGAIKSIIGTLEFFYKQSGVLIKYSKSNDIVSQLVGTTGKDIMSLTSFMSFLNNLVERDLGIVVRIKIRLAIRRITGLYKFFIKQILKMSKKLREMQDMSPLEPLHSILDSMMNVIQMVDTVGKMGFFKTRISLRRIERIFKRIVNLPLTILEHANMEAVNQNMEILRDTVKQLMELVESFNTVKVTKKRLIVGSINSILDLLDRIENKKDSVEKAKQLDTIFTYLVKVVDNIKHISLMSVYLVISATIALPLLKLIVTFVNSIKITKKTVQNVNQLAEVLSTIQASVSKFATTIGIVGAFGPVILLGVVIAMTAISIMVGGYILISKLVKRYKKDIKSANETLTGMTATLAAFAGILTKVSISVAALILSVTVMMAVLFSFLGEYVGMSKLVVKFEKIIKKGEKLLISISTTLLAFAKSISELTKDPKNKISNDTLLSLLLLSGIVTVIVGIMFLLNRVKRLTKKSMGILLSIAGTLLVFVGVLMLLSLITLSINIPLFIALGIIAAFILTIVGLCWLLKNQFKNIMIGLAILAVVVAAFIGLAYATKLIFTQIAGVDWKTMGLFFAIVVAMVATAALIGVILMLTGGIGVAAILIGLVTAIGVAWGFVPIAMALAQVYNYIGDITNWESMGFLFANIVAMAVSAAAIGAAILLTAGLGAAAIAAGVVAMIGITKSFISIGQNVAELYNVLPNSSEEEMNRKTEVLISPLRVITNWVAETSWDTILWLPTGTKALKESSKNLPDIAKNVATLSATPAFENGTKTLGQYISLIKRIDKNTSKVYEKFTEDSIKLMKQINKLDSDKLVKYSDMWAKMSEFMDKMKDLNIEELADAIVNRIAPAMEGISDNVDRIGSKSNETEFTTNPATTVPNTPQPTDATTKLPPEKPKDYTEQVERIARLLEEILETRQ